MRESDWLKSDNAVEMLASMPEQPSDRKLRLFACACCRHFENLLEEGPFTQAVETAEMFADGESSKAALKRARQGVREVRHEMSSDSTEARTIWVALWLAEMTASENAFGGVADEIQRLVTEGLLQPNEQPPSASHLRRIIGNPFHAAAIDADWKSSEVVTLAQSIYDERAFDQMPQLGKALKKAGCSDNDVLKHCRSKSPHVRGCWVVDQLIGRL